MIKAIIVDDDSYHVESIITMLNEHFKRVEILATSNNVPDAVEKIVALKPQLVFLDIELGQFTGFDMLEMISERDFEVIFTTSYNKYAIQAIRASALDYLEKPILKDKLEEALTRFKEKAGKERMLNLLSNFKKSYENQRIALPDKNGLSFFELKNIIRCQSDNSYTEFIISSEVSNCHVIKIIVSKGFKDFADFLLDKGFFYRIHNQHIVNINFIKKFVKHDGGYLIMDDKSGIAIPIARARKDDFLNFLQYHGIIL